MKKLLCFFITLTLFISSAKAQKVYSSQNDSLTFKRFVFAMQSKKKLPTGRLMVETAKWFLGSPYVASTLEKEPEGLVVNLQEFDCMTFVESVTALVRTLQCHKPSFDSYLHNLQSIRYRNGIINNYTDRLHYTSDWIFENQRRGFVKDVSQMIGGIVIPFNLSFMSTHPASYHQLNTNSAFVTVVASKEKEISQRHYYFIPEEQIEQHQSGIKDGDIIGFVTSVAGLDISHVAIAYHLGEKLTFIHASSALKKVVVNESSLVEYLKDIKHDIGVVIVRPLGNRR